MKQLKTKFKGKIYVKWSTLRSYHFCGCGVSTGYRIVSWGWIPGRGKMLPFSTTSILVLGAHPASYPMSTGEKTVRA
jgi:hypothetical protein